MYTATFIGIQNGERKKTYFLTARVEFEAIFAIHTPKFENFIFTTPFLHPKCIFQKNI